MAAQLNGGPPSSAARQTSRPMSEINVTPFVDVMLVLLVVFMVTAPLLTVGVTVDLPETESPVIQGQDEPLAVTVDATGQIFIQDTDVEIGELAAFALGSGLPLGEVVAAEPQIVKDYLIDPTIWVSAFFLSRPLKNGRSSDSESLKITRPTVVSIR